MKVSIGTNGDYHMTSLRLCEGVFVTVSTHRLIWALQTGEWPKQQIDHINGVKDDMRFSNLRDVSAKINHRNYRNNRIMALTTVNRRVNIPRRSAD